MKLDKFINVAKIADMHGINASLYLAYYHLKQNQVEEFTAGEAKTWLSENRLGNPNVTRLKDGLSASSYTVRGSETGIFKLRHDFVMELDGKFPQLSQQSQEVVDAGTIFPPVAYEKTRGYIESLARQINICYEEKAYDGCAVLMRRLEEVLLILAYQNFGIDGEIKDAKGDYFMLEGIVSNAQGNGKLKLSRTGKKTIERIRELGNLSAHGVTYQCRREYISEKIEEFRALMQEMLVKAGIR